MRTGILTYHRAHNYGAVLQTFALKNYLERISGNKVDVIDYFPHYHEQMYAIWPWSFFLKWGMKQKIRFLREFISISYKKKKRRQLFDNFIEQYLKPQSLVGEYDLVIYGSDQIWRYQDTPIYKGFNETYFGSGKIPSKRKITYSASMGKLDHFDNHISFLQQAFKNFDAIAVRESELLQKVNPLYSNDVHLTLDPVFLLQKKEWSKLVSPPKSQQKYVLLYNLLSEPLLTDLAKKIADERGLPVIEITGSVKLTRHNQKKEMIVGPLEFLSYFYYADFVVTSSFHGVSFSILFQKQFSTFLSKNSGRVTGLLKELNLEGVFMSDTNIDNIAKVTIDYQAVEERLKSLIKSSKAYLASVISNKAIV